jgi:hypothetical protein
MLVQEALFFTMAAFVTFGGAYAVLAYVADVAVNVYGWLDGNQMVQGLGLAESTPGPLIMVTQYVGFLGAWKLHGPFDPLVNGVLLGGLTTTYVTFLPCFMFIFAGAPYIEALARHKRLQAALTAVTVARGGGDSQPGGVLRDAGALPRGPGAGRLRGGAGGSGVRGAVALSHADLPPGAGGSGRRAGVDAPGMWAGWVAGSVSRGSHRRAGTGAR